MPGLSFDVRPEEIPFDSLRYSLNPQLVHSLTWAHRAAGIVEGMRFSVYGRRKLEQQARRRRIIFMVERAELRVKAGEVAHVLAGDLLPPSRRFMQEQIRKAAVLCDAAEELSRRVEPSTAELFGAYRDFALHGAPNWARFTGQPRAKLLDPHLSSPVPEPVGRLYAWMKADPLLSREPVLRAATLHWGLTIPCRSSLERLAIDAAVAHELSAGGVDGDGLLVLADHEPGLDALHLSGYYTTRTDFGGDLTHFFEQFVPGLARSLGELRNRLDSFQDEEDRLPWLCTRLPDELDRQIFDIIEHLGTARSQQILAGLRDPPPLRTLQRRLYSLVTDGLVVRLGGRKNATYRLAERA